MVLLFLSLCAWVRRFWQKHCSRADRFHRRGVSQPVGRDGLRIWTARTPDWNVLGYLITAGKLARPVAFVFGSTGDEITCTCDADYRKARKIARDGIDAVIETPFVFDLRAFDWEQPGRLEFILNLVLYPSDRKGRGVFSSSAGEIFGAMLDYSGGLRHALFEGAHEEWGTSRAPIPTFEMAVAGGGWCQVPADLKSHLDRVDPLPSRTNKNSGNSAVVTQLRGQPSSETCEIAAA